MKKENKPLYEIVERSNIVQYDDFGNTLRLCIVKYNDGKKEHEHPTQEWLDSSPQKGDIECKWSK